MDLTKELDDQAILKFIFQKNSTLHCLFTISSRLGFIYLAPICSDVLCAPHLNGLVSFLPHGVTIYFPHSKFS